MYLFFCALWPFLFFTSSAATAAVAALQYLQGARIRSRDSATADRRVANELRSPLDLKM